MAPIKRKSGDDAKTVSSNKRHKVGAESKTQPSSLDKETRELSTRPAKTAPVSLLVKEQPAFPRGGAGLLTPLERKQIRAKAIQDVAAEQKQTTDLFGDGQDDSDGSADDTGSDANTKESIKLSSKEKKKSKTARLASKTSSREENIAIESLSYKRLAVGSMILGRISAIGTQDLTVSLPNNLTGFVPLTEISRLFSEKLEKALLSEENHNAEEEEDAEEPGTDTGDEISLAAHFHIGQFVRVTVTTLGDEGSGKAQSKRRIELSLDPRKTNVGLSKSLLLPGCIVQAAVASVEDHGLVMDLGLESAEKARGFVSVKNLNTLTAPSDMKVGAVMLCWVQKASSNGKVWDLSADLMAGPALKHMPSIDCFLPGALVEILVTNTTPDGLSGKVMGLLDVTADTVHSGAFRDRESFLEAYKIGQKIRGRLVYTLPLAEQKKLGFSVLPNLITLDESESAGKDDTTTLNISSIVSPARVNHVTSGLGVYLTLSPSQIGFAHISRLSDKRIDSVSETSGPYKLDSEHKARILDYNSVDDLYILSLQKKTIEQPFLRIEDVPVGEVVKATIEKVVVGASGVQGLIVILAEGVSGFVPQIHMSDVALLHPEQKFRQGTTVTARVLYVDRSKRQIRLTLKKTLVNSDQKVWSNINEISAGDSAIGTLVKVESRGALVQFYGTVRGYLPVSEMSEAYIKDATEHFKVGQVLSVNAISVNPEENRLTLSCRERTSTNEQSLASIVPGTLVTGTIFEKSQDDLLLRLDLSGAVARLALDHVSDGSERKRKSVLEKLRVGQKLEDLLVLEVQRKGRLVQLSNKQTLVKSAQKGQFLKSFEDLREDAILTGFISNITDGGVYLRFAHGITGLITKQQVAMHAEDQPDFGMQLLQAVTARVISIDYRGATPRFWLTMREGTIKVEKEVVPPSNPVEQPKIVSPTDDSISSFGEFKTGRVTKAKIISIKDTQINVELAKDIQGRIDVSEMFDNWEDVKDRKQPLNTFSTKQILDVRILGAHDTRNHRFLPLSHRTGKNTVFELSAKPSTVAASGFSPLQLSNLQLGSSHLAFVNNVVDNYLMVNISPSIRGRIRAIDVSDDLSLATDLESNFPIGSAIRVRVLAIDVEKNRLDLSGKTVDATGPLNLDNLVAGTILPGRVTKISDKSILVQLSETIVGAVELIDMADDYTQSNTARYQKNDVIRVCVVAVDVPNKKVVLSTRPSKVLSSSMEVVDPEVISVKQLNINDVVRGFVSNVTDKGLFVTLGHTVTAFVRVTNLSDLYLKNWKENFQRDQLITGKVVTVDKDSGHVQLSLKKSTLDANYKPPTTFANMTTGEIVTGKIVKVESFGVFVLVDNSENVRGLCHRSEIAEKRIEDASKLFNEGDIVKAKVLKIDLPNRRINFGMKASYFADEDGDEDMADDAEEQVDSEMSDSDEEDGVELDDRVMNDEEKSDTSDAIDESDEEQEENTVLDHDNESTKVSSKKPVGLSVGGFDWYGMPALDSSAAKNATENTNAAKSKATKTKKKAEIQIDQTGDLDAYGPQSTDDFERLLLGEPDSSILWLQYMAFHLELGDIDQARTIGERALKTISLGQDSEKLNVWIALLNLENAYGDDESIEGIFKRACEYNDPQEIYNRLGSIYIQSGKHKKADELFQESLKKFTQDPKVYINYATFLFDTIGEADRGRALLSRALHILPPFTHFDLTSKFAQLEFKSSAGISERGRTIFEGLINSFPKRIDLFNVMLDMEMSHGDKDAAGKEQIRALFERIFTRKLKPKQAKHFFKKWLAWEEEDGNGDERKIEEVKAKAATWVKQSSQG